MSFVPELTADGSFTFFSIDYGEAFHSKYGARQEAESKFVQPTLLVEQAERSSFRLLDICYGLGYNTAAALEAVWRVNPTCHIEVMGLELDKAVPQAAIAHHLLKSWHPEIQELLTTLAQTYFVETPRFKAELLLGDARQVLQHMKQTSFDAIFLDPFSPPRCPQLWTIEFLTLVASFLDSNGRLATYSCSAAVRAALIAAGLKVGSTAPAGRRSPGTIAAWELALPALSAQEAEHLLTRAAVPYRDPTLGESAEEILQRRSEEQAHSPLETTSRWKKRWLIR